MKKYDKTEQSQNKGSRAYTYTNESKVNIFCITKY